MNIVLALAFSVTLDGQPVTDAEICIAKGRDFATQDFTCAKGDVTPPPGEWTAFARRGNDLVSDAAVTTSTQELRLVRAARADLSAWPAAEFERRFVYVPRTRSVIPVLDRVPADTLVVPFTAKDGRVVAAGEAASDGRLRVTPSPGVVVPVTIEKAPLGKAQPPQVTITDAAGKVHKPVAPMSSTAAGTELVFFRGVSDGTATVEGDRWKSVGGPAGTPLATTATSKLVVHWFLGNDPAVLARETPACNAKSELEISQPGKRFHFVLAQCGRGGCAAVAERALSPGEARGVIELEGIPAGRYRMEIEYPGLQRVWKNVEVTSGESTRADFEARWFTFFGKVTRGAKPAHVRLFGTVSDPESGEYHAIVSRAPDANGLEFLVPCDGSPQFNFVYDDPPKENARYDIEIPSNRVPVSVFDAASGSPVPRARVTLTALQTGSDTAAHFAGIGRISNDRGEADIGPVLTNRRLIVCAQHEDYLRKCTDPFTMKGVDEKVIRLDVQKAEKRAGRIVTGGNIEAGMVMFFTPEGSIIERLNVKPDGTFTMQKPHAAAEIFSFLSRSHPLYVFALQRPAGETFDISLPAGPLRSFDVVRAPTATELGFFTIALGDLIVPGQVITDYVARRGAQPSLPPGASTPVRDVIETGPISVIFIPVEYLRTRSGRGDPVLGFPEGRSLPRQLLGDRTSVTFE